MERMSKVLGTFVMVAFVMGGTILSAKAAEKMPGDKLAVFGDGRKENCYFDADRYAAENPDVAAVFGNDKNMLWNHYKTYGIYERRKAHGTTDKVNARLRVYDMAEEIVRDEMSDREKIQAVHDWIVNHTVYDHQNLVNGTIPPESYELEGVMLYGTAVCAGYAKTFDSFMDVLGIEAECVSGLATNSVGHTRRHAWNKVMLDGNWLYVDCTWDDPVSESGNVLRYNYFLITYDEISRNHIEEQ